MEVGKNQNISKKIGYLLELIIKIWRLVEFLFYFRNLTNLGHFSMENPSYRSKSHFSGMDGFGKNSAVKETLLLRIL